MLCPKTLDSREEKFHMLMEKTFKRGKNKMEETSGRATEEDPLPG